MSRKRSQKKISEYGKQLQEKQKLKREYGLREKQFANIYKKASTKKESTGLILLQSLELRLDNVLYRSGFFKTRKQARQAVTHGHIIVNDKKATLPSLQLKIDDGFKLKNTSISQSGDQEVSGWLKINNKLMSGKVERLPERDEISQEIDEQLVIEYYSR